MEKSEADSRPWAQAFFFSKADPSPHHLERKLNPIRRRAAAKQFQPL
jgi:hypothetical protein